MRPPAPRLLLGEAAAKGRGVSLEQASRSSPRRPDRRRARTAPSALRLCAAARWWANIQVILAGPGERITLSHSAEDRSIFARGALAAARWGQGKKPGLYAMTDVLGPLMAHANYCSTRDGDRRVFRAAEEAHARSQDRAAI